MSGLLEMSEATALAIHAMMYLEANRSHKISTREIASVFGASQAHLAKVMQRLVKAGLVKSVRGPGGGFTLEKPGSQVTLLELYELFEGTLPEKVCVFHNTNCALRRCVMESFLNRMNKLVVDYMGTTTLDGFGNFFRKEQIAS
jgi:Rrf2 family transcriptional regulator, nitric oxide-sensitive transcriptional repressor